MAEIRTERRKARRVDANLNLEVKVPRADGSLETASLETINISSSGVYFKSDHFIEPMTKLAMELEVQVPAGEGGAETALVPCEGLVVRTNPEAESADCRNYEVAVFFTHIESEGMANLERHITMLIEQLD
jgi:hypothetical protein